MINKAKEMTAYFRSAITAQSNISIDFKENQYYTLTMEELVQGKINLEVCESIFAEKNQTTLDNESQVINNSIVHAIICAKTIKTIYDANEKIHVEIEELPGVYYIPVTLSIDGLLSFDYGDKKLPWFPREYLQPMVEPKLAIGNADIVDNFMSNNIDKIFRIDSWSDYADFFIEFYESVTESKFDKNKIRNIDIHEPEFELENNMYLFIDSTVNANYHIMNLYNHLLQNDKPKPLYENFISMKINDTSPLLENDLLRKQAYCGQMGGEYPLSPSQREAINHYNCMDEGEILAVNGPPGTGKTTLLQSIVADMYVKRAINEEKAPLIVASSTNNQAVTNIISSFGNIKKVGISNLEERWIEGVNSFATYFPSTSKINEAKSNKYQYSNYKGEFFVSDIESKENIEKSKIKLIKKCNEYFGSEYNDISTCQKKLHDELLFFEKSKNTLLSLVQEVAGYDLNGETIDKYLHILEKQIKEKQMIISNIRQRLDDWEGCYKRIPFFYKLFKFIKSFANRIQTEFRLFINIEEQGFLNEYMSLDEIKEKYSQLYATYSETLHDLLKKKDKVDKIKRQYDNELDQLRQRNIILHEKENEVYKLEIDFMNCLLDKKIRYVEFWLAVHYFECRWTDGEDRLSEKQKGTNYKNVLEKFYNRLNMITPCLVMTFYMMPRQFLAYGDQKKFYLYNYIDLLIVDEAGQVSPEIAAGSFSLAKKALVVGDIYQIAPVWSVNRALDKALALSNRVIQSLDEYKLLEKTGLNSSCSSVMKVASKCCKYEKFNDRGLFLSEHRRCYDEIIDYCNELVYKGNLQPMRGKGKQDKRLAIKEWPQMGFKQIDMDNSNKRGNSRVNRREAVEIAKWLRDNYELIIKAYSGEAEKNLVGVITPFKSQVQYIKAELKKFIPRYYSEICVGTVHTFQGAERKIIILSTVYGRQDGCYFIDANKGLMNVAVSRAKDNFFVFGDINCLKDTRSSASGLLRERIHSNMIL